jgi:hypothetical protein
LCLISPALLPADCQRLQPVWRTCPFGPGRLQRQPRPGLDRLRGAASLAVRAQLCVSSPALCRGRELCRPAGLLSAVRQPGSKRPAIYLPMAFKSAPIAPTAHRYRPWHLGGLPGPAPAVCWQPLEKDWNPR